MILMTLSAATTLIATPASGPVYLHCDLVSDSGSHQIIDMALNEAAGTAGYTVSKTGYSQQQIPAVFSPTSVDFEPRGGVRMHFHVDRVTLDALEVISEGSASITFQGKCAIAPPVERAF